MPLSPRPRRGIPLLLGIRGVDPPLIARRRVSLLLLVSASTCPDSGSLHRMFPFPHHDALRAVLSFLVCLYSVRLRLHHASMYFPPTKTANNAPRYFLLSLVAVFHPRAFSLDFAQAVVVQLPTWSLGSSLLVAPVVLLFSDCNKRIRMVTFCPFRF